MGKAEGWKGEFKFVGESLGLAGDFKGGVLLGVYVSPSWLRYLPMWHLETEVAISCRQAGLPEKGRDSNLPTKPSSQNLPCLKDVKR